MSILIDGVNISPMLYKEPHYLDVALDHSMQDRCLSTLSRDVHVGSVLDQALRHLDMVESRSPKERRPLETIDCVDIRAVSYARSDRL